MTQERIQAEAEKIAIRFGIPKVVVAANRWADEATRFDIMRHEMAHYVHGVQVAQRGKNAGDNVHGRNWRAVAKRVGAEAKDAKWCRMARVPMVQAPAAVNVAQVAKAVQMQAVANPRTKVEWVQYIAQKGLRKLGQGASRTTYALDDKRVIKIEHALWGNGVSQCEAEVKMWNQATPAQREVLAEIFDSGKGWEVMERAKMTCSEMGMGHGAFRTITTDIGASTGVRDLHEANVAYFGNGRFKVIDYGIM